MSTAPLTPLHHPKPIQPNFNTENCSESFENDEYYYSPKNFNQLQQHQQQQLQNNTKFIHHGYPNNYHGSILMPSAFELTPPDSQGRKRSAQSIPEDEYSRKIQTSSRQDFIPLTPMSTASSSTSSRLSAARMHNPSLAHHQHFATPNAAAGK
jgi:hypothetical protein